MDELSKLFIKISGSVLALLMTLSFISCKSGIIEKQDFFADEDLSQIFTSTEIESLASMVDFVDSAIVAITNNTDLTEAYHDFFEAYGKQLVEASQKLNPIEEKVKFAFLDRMDTGAFNAIWKYETHFDQLIYKDTLLTDVDYIKHLRINPFGKYLDYLLLVGEKDQRHLELHDFILSMGDLSTSGGLWMVHEEYDFGLLENRILAAVYILRIEDSNETKLDRYFREVYGQM